MALFGFLKRKKGEVDIPPPPAPDIDMTQAPAPEARNEPVHDMSDLQIPNLPELPDIGSLEKPKQEQKKTAQVAPKHPATAAKTEEAHKKSVMVRQVHEDVHRKKIVTKKHSAPPQEEHKPVQKPRERKILESPKQHGPIYIKANYYVDVLKDIDAILAKLGTAEEVAKKLNDVKNAKDAEFEKYRNYLEDVQRKSVSVDKTLFSQR